MIKDYTASAGCSLIQCCNIFSHIKSFICSIPKSLSTKLYPNVSNIPDFAAYFFQTSRGTERKNPSPCTPDLTMLNLQHYRNPITGIFQEPNLVLLLLSGIIFDWDDIMNLFYRITVSPALYLIILKF